MFPVSNPLGERNGNAINRTIMNHYLSTKSLIEEIKERMERPRQPIWSKEIDFDEPISLNDLIKLYEEFKSYMSHTDWIAMRDEDYWKRRDRICDDTDSMDCMRKQLIFLISEITPYLQNKHHDKGSQ